jgi:hypothetical protein
LSVVASVPVAPLANSISAAVVSPVGSGSARRRQRADPPHRPDGSGAVEHVNSHAGHAAGARFRRRCTPAVRRQRLEPVVAVVAFHVHDGAERAGCDQLAQRLHRRHQAEVMADRDRDAGARAGVEHGLRIRLGEC